MEDDCGGTSLSVVQRAEEKLGGPTAAVVTSAIRLEARLALSSPTNAVSSDPLLLGEIPPG